MIELQERTIDQLSGGEWRRMILARSLAQNASILLLDEPTAGLDMKYQFECLGHVRRMVKERQLIAVITLHDLNQASMFADRIAILANKELLSIGPPQEVMRPDLIRKAFGIDVMVVSHPTESIPMVVPILASPEV
jgi:iron complex transport system ATP-binding protein